jgi:tricorn protease-like protein
MQKKSGSEIQIFDMDQKDVEEWREDLPDLRLSIQKSDVNIMKEFNAADFKKQKWQAYAKKAS